MITATIPLHDKVWREDRLIAADLLFLLGKYNADAWVAEQLGLSVDDLAGKLKAGLSCPELFLLMEENYLMGPAISTIFGGGQPGLGKRS